jgi:hypothetical protein
VKRTRPALQHACAERVAELKPRTGLCRRVTLTPNVEALNDLAQRRVSRFQIGENTLAPMLPIAQRWD